VTDEHQVDPAVSTLRFLLIDSCNLRCEYCHNEFQGDRLAGRRPSWDWSAVRGLLSETANRGPLAVKLSGGEPLTRWSVLTRLLRLSQEAGAGTIALFSNLTLLSAERMGQLRRGGVDRVHVNLPSFRPEVFAVRTGQPRWSLDAVLDNARLARSMGAFVQLNLVVPELGELPTERFLHTELAGARRHRDAWDALALLADDWGRDPAGSQRWIGAVVAEVGATGQPGGAGGLGWAGRRLLTGRCTNWRDPVERAAADVYIVAPGRPLQSYARGRAYR
jgi:pyruvate-formate lyase-activating enzyme